MGRWFWLVWYFPLVSSSRPPPQGSTVGWGTWMTPVYVAQPQACFRLSWPQNAPHWIGYNRV